MSGRRVGESSRAFVVARDGLPALAAEGLSLGALRRGLHSLSG